MVTNKKVQESDGHCVETLHASGTFTYVGATVVVLLLAVASPGYSESGADKSESDTSDVQDEVRAWGSGRHSSELSLGVARADGTTEIGLSIEYEYELTERWGIGAVVGHTPKADNYDGSSSALAMVHLHPTPVFSLSAGAGIERVHTANGHDQQMLVFGIAREFQAGRISITPNFSLEIIGSKMTNIFDITFAMSFQKKPTLSIALAQETS